MKYFSVLLLLVSLGFGQQKEQRYQIIQVDKISGSEIKSTNVSPIATATEKKTIILLDTQTGKCWMLVPVSTKIDESSYAEDYQWMPLSFMQLGKSIDLKKFLPPQ